MAIENLNNIMTVNRSSFFDNSADSAESLIDKEIDLIEVCEEEREDLEFEYIED